MVFVREAARGYRTWPHLAICIAAGGIGIEESVGRHQFFIRSSSSSSIVVGGHDVYGGRRQTDLPHCLLAV